MLGHLRRAREDRQARGQRPARGQAHGLIEEAEKRLSESRVRAHPQGLGKTDASRRRRSPPRQALLEGCGALAAVEKRVARLCDEAQAALQNAGLTDEGTLRLVQLARKFAFRDS